MSLTVQIFFPIFVMVSAHCIGDYPLQGQFLGTYKSKNDFILLVHCFIYSAIITLGYWVLHMNGFLDTWIDLDHYTDGFFVILITHFAIDKFKCVMRNLLEKEFGDMNHPEAHKTDLQLFYLDQALHFIFLIIVPITIVR